MDRRCSCCKLKRAGYGLSSALLAVRWSSTRRRPPHGQRTSLKKVSFLKPSISSSSPISVTHPLWPVNKLLLQEKKEDNMDIELLLAEPRNVEYHLGEPGGLLDHSSQVEDDSTVYWNGGTEQAFTEHEVDDFLEPSMLGSFLPWGTQLHGPRGNRVRRQSWKDEVISHLFGSQQLCTRGGRKNNDHWSHEEVMKLVDGIVTHGVGKWTDIKDSHFSTSIRSTSHLKDKWRNLVKTYKKEEPKTHLHIEQSLVERIREIDAKDPYPKKRRP
ncbi:hypothetical protein EJB05_22177, partial [Eragrostis curvula]